MNASMDVGVGGLLTTLSKMALINGVGFNIDYPGYQPMNAVLTQRCWRSPRPTRGILLRLEMRILIRQRAFSPT
nr:hypothetical protein [Vulcanisaeta sp. JCM 16159]